MSVRSHPNPVDRLTPTLVAKADTREKTDAMRVVQNKIKPILTSKRVYPESLAYT